MMEMNISKPNGDDETGGIRMGFIKKYFDKKTIVAFVVVLIMGVINYELVGFWGIFLYLILGPIGATIGNAIRLWVMPAGILTFEGFWGLVKVKLFWGYGPQFIGALICLGIAGSMVQNSREKHAIKQVEKNVKIIEKELKNTQSIPKWTDELEKTLSELEEEYRGPWQQTEFETTAQFNARVEKELKNIRDKYQRKGIEVGKLYRFPWEFFITDVSYHADGERLYFATERAGRHVLESAPTLLLFEQFYTMLGLGGDRFCISKISADQARSIKEKLGFSGVDSTNRKIPNDVIKKIVTTDDGRPMLRTVAYIIDENGQKKLQAMEEELKANEKKKQQALADEKEQARVAMEKQKEQKKIALEKQKEQEATVAREELEKTMSSLFNAPVFTDEMLKSINAFNSEFKAPQQSEFETTEEYEIRCKAACERAIESLGVKSGLYRYVCNSSIKEIKYSTDNESLYLAIEAFPWTSGYYFHYGLLGDAVTVMIYGKSYLYKDGYINIPRDQAKEMKGKLESPNTRVNHLLGIGTGARISISAEPFFAITSE